MSVNNSAKRKVEKETDWGSSVDKLKRHVKAGTIPKLFEEDPQIIFELIKILYEDVLDNSLKVDVLMTIEQECCEFININSVEQVIASLVDIFETEQGGSRTVEIRQQLLITITTILIDNDEFLEQEQGSFFISKLFELLRKTNNVSNRRIRATACNCLTQIESWKPCVLWKWKDSLSQMVKDERTDIFQDYLHLLVTVTKNSLEESYQDNDDKGVLQTVSYIMDNASLLTGPGALAMIQSVVRLVQISPGLSPSVNKFRGEILSDAEERVLLSKVLDVVNHAAIPLKIRLLTSQWLASFVQQHKPELCLKELCENTQPSVFDPLHVHACKLLLRCLCTSQRDSKAIPQDLHYLNQLAATTGGVRVTRVLYYVLFFHVGHRSCEEVHAYALSVTKALFQKFPHLIPMIVDFLKTLQASQSNAKFHLGVLTLLHNTVLSIPLNTLLSNYQNFLQVWVLSAQDPNMQLQKQLRCMLDLAKEANTRALDNWTLGCLLLSICRTMMLHHQTDIFYCQMGDLLFYLMRDFGDPEIQDYARFYYALLTLTSDTKAKEVLNADLVDNLKFSENLADFFPGSMVQVLPSDIRVIDDAPISCSRKNVSVEFQEQKQSVKSHNSVKEYIDRHRSGKTLHQPAIKVELTAAIKEKSDMHNLIAVSVVVKHQESGSLVEEIHVPFMNKKGATDVTFKFAPKEPIPCTLSLKSFLSHERATLQCDLDPVVLTISDFLVPFPWDKFPIHDTGDRRQLFDSLWNVCTNDEGGGCRKGVESVKIMSCNSEILSNLWKDAIVPDPECTRNNNNCFLFLLVPSFHFLLQTHSRLADTVVEIASDFPPVLEYVDKFLEDLVVSKT